MHFTRHVAFIAIGLSWIEISEERHTHTGPSMQGLKKCRNDFRSLARSQFRIYRRLSCLQATLVRYCHDPNPIPFDGFFLLKKKKLVSHSKLVTGLENSRP